ncbi:MAG: thiamine phosphate synthase [Nitrospirota bacterium]
MVKSALIRGLYVISDASFPGGRSHEDIVSDAVKGGARIIQLRDKLLAPDELYPIALRLRGITREAGALLIINDSIELAMAVDADGVHLGQEDLSAEAARKILGESKIIGVSTHSVEQAVAAFEAGADYIGFGPIFNTATKDAGAAKGPAAISAVKKAVNIPVAAIGGINIGNAAEAIAAGADALAVIGAVAGARDVAAAVRELSALFSGGNR